MYAYLSYRHGKPRIEKCRTFKEALRSFLSDFDSGEAYGIGIYVECDKALYLPDFKDREQSVSEAKRLGYEVMNVYTFEGIAV